MTQRPIECIVLSGGAGTRLWPLSRESFPKQFYDLAHSGRPLLIDTLERLSDFGTRTVLTTENLKFASMGIIKRYGLDAQVMGEPKPMNTAPAIALATKVNFLKNPDTLMGIFPADHFIQNKKAFSEVLRLAFRKAEEGFVVTLGIKPTYASTGYGYIELSKSIDSKTLEALEVKRFIEKPEQTVAETFLKAGNYAWNAGMFVFSAKVMAELFAKLAPELWSCFDGVNTDSKTWPAAFEKVKNISIDYAIMEKCKNLMCIPADIGWSDVGSWEEVELRGKSLGQPIEVSGAKNFYTGQIPEAKRVAFVGVSDLIVVDTPDALLISKKGEGQKVKEVVQALKKEGSGLTKAHSFEDRPWGRFEVLSDTSVYKSKKISVWPKQKLSYQSHKKRAEHWIIVQGSAEVTLEDKIHRLKAGEHIFIPCEAKHRIANPGTEVLEFIEVQTGTYFGEDDIVRYSDDYGRT